jgi:hypothetical protein
MLLVGRVAELKRWQDAEKVRQRRFRFAQKLNVPKRTPSPLRSLWPCWPAFLSILRDVLLLS